MVTSQTDTALSPNSTLHQASLSVLCILWVWQLKNDLSPLLQGPNEPCHCSKNPCALANHALHHLWQSMDFYCFHTSAVCRMPHLIQHFQTLFLSHMYLRKPTSFQGLIIFHCLDGLQFTYAFSHWRKAWSFSSFAVTHRVIDLPIWRNSREMVFWVVWWACGLLPW
jgi:hypothetical protein